MELLIILYVARRLDLLKYSLIKYVYFLPKYFVFSLFMRQLLVVN